MKKVLRKLIMVIGLSVVGVVGFGGQAKAIDPPAIKMGVMIDPPAIMFGIDPPAHTM